MHRHVRALVLIAVLEMTALIGLVTWALVRDVSAPGAPTRASTAPKEQSPGVTFKTPVIKPIPVADKLKDVTALVATNSSTDKRLFVVEQAGTIQILDAARQVGGKPFLDISGKVLNDGEMGLLGLAFHPDYEQNGYFYVFYVNKQKQTTVARYQLDTSTGLARANSEKVLLQLQQTFDNHKGGQLAFGPDGYLYIGIGDGGSAGDPNNQAQNKNLWFGKILRLDVDQGDPYGVPANNPFAKEAGAKPEIWAYGLRNPWRFSFDRSTHALYIADVGQGSFEEIDLQPAGSKGGENYGWRCYEGGSDYNTAGCKPKTDYTSPILVYDHGNNRCSITGGYVYRGALEPSLTGKYFYGDYCSGELFYAEQRDGGWKTTVAASTEGAITTFGEDSSGELYFADRKNDRIYQITDGANN